MRDIYFSSVNLFQHGEATEPMIKELDEDREESQDPEDINFWGSVYTTKFVAPRLRNCGGRLIVLSAAASWIPVPRMSISFFSLIFIKLRGVSLRVLKYVFELMQGKFLLLKGTTTLNPDARDLVVTHTMTLLGRRLWTLWRKDYYIPDLEDVQIGEMLSEESLQWIKTSKFWNKGSPLLNDSEWIDVPPMRHSMVIDLDVLTELIHGLVDRTMEITGAFKLHMSSIICACTGRSIKFQKSISEHVGNQVKLSERIFSLTYGMTARSYLDIYTGGSETSSTTVDWAMTEMLKHPRILQKAQNEIREVVSRRGLVDVKYKLVDFGNACPEVLLAYSTSADCGHLHAYALNLQLSRG
ncbi:hydroxysteroid dehydrogenase 1 [Artemisia annua]|uniref:Hydroxysteroid dehydrogenase 1 n=1 Tax=Artemisia annua TaxID=35608 RepID=A0A2U1KR64_ARTAN|nr:hydroxysteroid dehydrogenase 1 [Artemisia annua]